MGGSITRLKGCFSYWPMVSAGERTVLCTTECIGCSEILLHALDHLGSDSTREDHQAFHGESQELKEVEAESASYKSNQVT